MNKYKTFEELKEELGDKYDKFMYDMNLELVTQKEKEQQELERYKNIIDEIERYFIDMFNRTQDTKYLDDLQKLKELRGFENE